ncbi:plastocyanin/azurin family copper-binding protein [Thiohalorhabdus methylotrophus]|uniref:Plastocyanin/azurin family copper-binding protein n=1 Tax=Thiohalorhabdus methylotrophus TaxID=3242694 RepID=A0ABV4TT88_9GAMM
MKSPIWKVAVLCMLMVAAGSAWAETHEVEVRNLGSDGKRMVFEPALVEAAPGDTVRFVWKDMGHNAATYHPDNRGKPALVPSGAKVWDSGFKQPGDTFEVTLETEGAHHYFCLPHEGMGMVGIIAVGDAGKGPGLEAVERADLPDRAKVRFRALHDQLGN